MLDPACPYCGARGIQRLQTMPMHPDARRTRQRAILDHWEQHGHDRQRIRTLALGEFAVAGQEKGSASDNRTKTKRPSRGTKSGMG